MKQNDCVQLTIPATFLAVRTADAALVALLASVGGVAADVGYQIELAFHEVCTNIVEHAYGADASQQLDIQIWMAYDPRKLHIELRDRGRSFDPATYPAPDLETVHEGGYGLFLVRSLMDEVAYEASSGQNIWRLAKQV